MICYETFGYSIVIFIVAIIVSAIEFGTNLYLSRKKAILGRAVIMGKIIAALGVVVFLLSLFGVGC
jgi:hypothetical protein